MPPVYETLLLNTAVPQIQAAQAGDSYVMVVNATTPALRITQTGTGNALEVEDSANPDATPFVVSAAGDVGVGTNAPAYKLDVNGGSSDAMSLFNSTNANGAHLRFAASGTVKSYIGGAPGFLGSGTADDLGIRAVGSVLFATNGSSVDMTLDSSGNLGLGVTPKAWQSAPALEGTSFAINPLLGVDQTGFSTGCYQDVYGLDTGWKSKGAYRPTLYAQNGSHIFYVSTAIPTGANQAITFTQAMTLDASGNLGVGQTSPATLLDVRDGVGSILTLGNTGTFAAGESSYLKFRESNTALAEVGWEADTNELRINNRVAYTTFYTANTERARITSGGYFKASNTGTYVGTSTTYHELRNNANANTVRISNSIASGYTDAIIQAQFSGYTPNAATAWFLFCDDTTNQKAGILSTGTFESRTSTYGGVSDVKLKTNIVDANSQWNDLKAVRVRNFAFKDEPNTTMLGVVAQEIEEVSPGLVYETPDRDKEGNDLGTTTKSVKYSILYMKAIKALQEAMARIETLEAKIAALEAK